jgi:hypothetical protein
MKKEVAFKLNTIAIEENLPLPVILYPGHYGAFIAFKEDLNSPDIFFCSCSYESISNYIEMKKCFEKTINSDITQMYILDSGNFPLQLVEFLMKSKIPDDKVLQNLQFKNKICHECNLCTPSYKYCVPMYGGAFKQNYGWYIRKQAYEFGINPLNLIYVKDLCPDEIIDEIKIQPPSTGEDWRKINDDLSFLERQELIKVFEKQKRKVWNIIEDVVRTKFKHKKVGEAWTSETILFYIIKNLYPEYTIRRHYRPKFLNGLELDIFIEDLQIGIEYQGIQHYKPIKHWGGEKSLKKVQERDKKKRNICKELNIPIINFEYKDDLNNKFVLSKINSIIK